MTCTLQITKACNLLPENAKIKTNLSRNRFLTKFFESSHAFLAYLCVLASWYHFEEFRQINLPNPKQGTRKSPA